jgi:hypothetical protein
MSKLTLNVDPSIAARAKRYAKQQGVSVSKMVEAYLAAVSEPSSARDLPPILRSVLGTLKKADREEYTKHAIEKYR